MLKIPGYKYCPACDTVLIQDRRALCTDCQRRYEARKAALERAREAKREKGV